jgi:hypothetical protein
MSSGSVRQNDESNLVALVVDGIELHPTQYQEAVGDGLLSINAIAMVPAEANERVRTLLKDHSPVPVVRRGIADSPVIMAFGKCAWSTHPGGTKYSLFLREESGAPAKLRSHEIAEHRRHDMLAYRAGFLDELAILLVSKGVITEQELEGVHRRADAAIRDRMLNWLEVPDVDELKR